MADEFDMAIVTAKTNKINLYKGMRLEREFFLDKRLNERWQRYDVMSYEPDGVLTDIFSGRKVEYPRWTSAIELTDEDRATLLSTLDIDKVNAADIDVLISPISELETMAERPQRRLLLEVRMGCNTVVDYNMRYDYDPKKGIPGKEVFDQRALWRSVTVPSWSRLPMIGDIYSGSRCSATKGGDTVCDDCIGYVDHIISVVAYNPIKAQLLLNDHVK